MYDCPADTGDCLRLSGSQTITLLSGPDEPVFTFDHVAGPQATQEHFFRGARHPLHVLYTMFVSMQSDLCTRSPAWPAMMGCCICSLVARRPQSTATRSMAEKAQTNIRMSQPVAAALSLLTCMRQQVARRMLNSTVQRSGCMQRVHSCLCGCRCWSSYCRECPVRLQLLHLCLRSDWQRQDTHHAGSA